MTHRDVRDEAGGLCAPRRSRARRAARLAAFGLLALLPALLAACGPSARNQRAERLAAGREKLEADPSAALFIARDALKAFGEDAPLDLLAATACLRLDRRSEAVEFATNGLAADGLSADLQADLEWARGTAYAGLYKELNNASDWRSANGALDRATAAGNHRAEAATLLVLLQDMGTIGNTDRQLKYARLLFELDPNGAAAQKVRALLESKGLKP